MIEEKLSKEQEFVAAGEAAALDERLNDLSGELGVTREEVQEHFQDEWQQAQQETLEYLGILRDAAYEFTPRGLSRSWALTKIPSGQWDGARLGLLTDSQIKVLWKDRKQYESDAVFTAKLKQWRDKFCQFPKERLNND